MPESGVILRTVVLLTGSCAVLEIAVAIFNAFVPMPQADVLVSTFTEQFKLGTVAILALIGGRGGAT